MIDSVGEKHTEFLDNCAHRSQQIHACGAQASFVHYVHMKIMTTTQARKHIKAIVDRVKYRGEVFAIGRRNSIDALVIRFPDAYNEDLNDITNVNAHSKSFDFLRDEPELYSVHDLKRRYA